MNALAFAFALALAVPVTAGERANRTIAAADRAVAYADRASDYADQVVAAADSCREAFGRLNVGDFETFRPVGLDLDRHGREAGRALQLAVRYVRNAEDEAAAAWAAHGSVEDLTRAREAQPKAVNQAAQRADQAHERALEAAGRAMEAAKAVKDLKYHAALLGALLQRGGPE